MLKYFKHISFHLINLSWIPYLYVNQNFIEFCKCTIFFSTFFKVLHQLNGDKLFLSDNVIVLFETDSLTNASPSAVARSVCL